MDEVIAAFKEIPYEHPDTVKKNMNDILEDLYDKGLVSQIYKNHDFRRTWISDMLDIHPVASVQSAVGHSKKETTEQYRREKKNEEFLY